MALVRLADTFLTFEDPAQDIRGRRVVNATGDEVGTVDDVIVDIAGIPTIRLLEVTNGGFLGFGASRFLVLVEDIACVGTRNVHLAPSGERVAFAAYDPVLRPLQPDELYGYPSSWSQPYL